MGIRFSLPPLILIPKPSWGFFRIVTVRLRLARSSVSDGISKSFTLSAILSNDSFNVIFNESSYSSAIIRHQKFLIKISATPVRRASAALCEMTPGSLIPSGSRYIYDPLTLPCASPDSERVNVIPYSSVVSYVKLYGSGAGSASACLAERDAVGAEYDATNGCDRAKPR
ncbi:hypothetical protein DERF_014903 [Dermatophagoides farinae]|uniref:Uncharacterized protein n=1 Tax=Dermatophagoides farinae TaxID=6954 RepID=A0A922HQ57_DERFA|nr:hypothetical protein DERF_014903 [Dermatophagoides farinae]